MRQCEALRGWECGKKPLEALIDQLLTPSLPLFVANHAFDCIGAKAYGFRSVFIDRRQRPFGESPFQPDLIVKNFDELSDILT